MGVEKIVGESSERPAVLVATSIFDQFGGVQTYMRLLIRALADCGRLHAVHSFHDRPDNETAREWSERFGFDFHTAGGSKARFVGNLLTSELQNSFAVLGHLSLGPVGWLLREFTGQISGYATVLHGVEAWESLPWLRRKTVGASDVILSTTPYTRDRFSEANELTEATHGILPLALEPDRFEGSVDAEPNPGAPKLEILTVGRLGKGEQYKGVDDTIRAISIAADRGLDVHYTVIGDGDDRPRLERLAKSEGVYELVDFRGHVSETELEQSFERAGVFAMPSSGEGFGLVYLEAMYYGLPIIACPEGGAQFVVDDGSNGISVEAGDADEIADAITTLSDSEIRAELARGAKNDVRGRFSYQRFQEDVEQLLVRHADRNTRH
jgi:glycosyltransferase involved in cell wall biosynthesis